MEGRGVVMYNKRMASNRTANVALRVRPRELAAWLQTAKRADVTLSEWIRASLNVLAKEAQPRTARTSPTGDSTTRSSDSTTPLPKI